MDGFLWSFSRRVTQTNSPERFSAITGSSKLSLAGMVAIVLRRVQERPLSRETITEHSQASGGWPERLS